MIILREMTAEDIDGVLIVEREAFSTPWSERLFYDELKNPHTVYYVCEDDGKIVAYGGVWHVLDEGQITNIAVKSKYRKSGVGSRLLDAIIGFSKDNDLSVVELEVRASNEPAIGLYKKFGFREVGVRKNYYKNPTEDALLMNLEL